MISPAYRVVSATADSLQLDLVMHGPSDVNDAASGSVPVVNSGPVVHAPFDPLVARSISVLQYREDRAAVDFLWSVVKEAFDAGSTFRAEALARCHTLALVTLRESVDRKVRCGYLLCLH